MYRKIMVPLDGSKTSKLGLKEAITLAREWGSKLRLLNVVDTSVINASLDTYANVNDLIALLRRNGESILKEATESAARRGVKAEHVIVEAVEKRTAEVIVDEARRWHADLIVMGTHGRRGFNRMFLGSDAEGVARMATAPVMLIRAKSENTARDGPKIGRH